MTTTTTTTATNADHIKDNLSKELKSTIRSGSDELDQNGAISDAVVQTLCNIIEAIFIHGLKDPFFKRGSRYAKYPEPNFWPLLHKYTHVSIMQQISAAKHINSDIGKARAWIRIVLNEDALEHYLNLFWHDPIAMCKYYDKTAYLRDLEHFTVMIGCIKEMCDFGLYVPINSPFLNCWTPTPLILSGLVAGKPARLEQLRCKRREPSSLSSRSTSLDAADAEVAESALDLIEPQQQQQQQTSCDDPVTPTRPLSRGYSGGDDDDLSSVYSHPSMLDGAATYYDSSHHTAYASYPLASTPDSSINCSALPLPPPSFAPNDSIIAGQSHEVRVQRRRHRRRRTSKSSSDEGCQSRSDSSTTNLPLLTTTTTTKQSPPLPSASASAPASDGGEERLQTHQQIHDDMDLNKSSSEQVMMSDEASSRSEIARAPSIPESIEEEVDLCKAIATITATDGSASRSPDVETLKYYLTEPSNSSSLAAAPPLAPAQLNNSGSSVEVMRSRNDQANPIEIQKRTVIWDVMSPETTSVEHTPSGYAYNTYNTYNVAASEQQQEGVDGDGGADGVDAHTGTGTGTDTDTGTDTGTSHAHSHENQRSVEANCSNNNYVKVKVKEPSPSQPPAASGSGDDKAEVTTIRDTNNANDDDGGGQGEGDGEANIDQVVANNITKRSTDDGGGMMADALALKSSTSQELNGHVAAPIPIHASKSDVCIDIMSPTSERSTMSLQDELAMVGERERGESAGNSLLGKGWANHPPLNLLEYEAGSGQSSSTGTTESSSHNNFDTAIRNTVVAGRGVYEQRAVVVDEMDMNGEDEYGISRAMIPLLTTIPREKGLDEQNFRCASCMRSIGPTFADYMVCGLDAKYYCDGCCRRGDQSVIPSRLLHNWDFAQRAICRANMSFINAVADRPIIRIDKVNPSLYEHCDEMRNIKFLREKMALAVMYLLTCRESVADDLRMRLWPKEYLFNDIHLYSFTDLLSVLSGQLERHLQSIINYAVDHIRRCLLCAQKGFVCEICSCPRVIYPFQVEITFRCSKCYSVYHKECIGDRSCPKCLRREQYAKQPDISPDHLPLD